MYFGPENDNGDNGRKAWRGERPDHPRDTQQMSVKWGDKTISIVGLHSIVVGVLTLALVLLGLLLRESVMGSNESIKGIYAAIEKQTEIQANQHTAISEEVRDAFGKMQVNQSKVADMLDAQVYLMTKTDSERKLYKLDMPESLRRRIR